MGLNSSKGNMYEFVTHTWNTVKGACYHDCSYCYMKRWGKLNPVRFDEKELKTDLGSGNFIFVGSSCDMWAQDIPEEWINKSLEVASKYKRNGYLFQSKNPHRFLQFELPLSSAVCTTIETNRWYSEIMKNSPEAWVRAMAMHELVFRGKVSYVTIEPIMDFDLEPMVKLIKMCIPKQVNIGADTSKSGLPEPSRGKILELISELEKFTIVHQKSNLRRLL